jgi:hypothetical protein
MDNEVTRGYGTGATLLTPDTRDFEIKRLPGVIAVTAGAVEVARRKIYDQFISHVYDQGTIPSCVVHSTAGQQSIYQKMEQEDRVYDATSVYWEVGGNGSQGVPARVVLDYAREKGMPLLADKEFRNRIESYAFTRDPETMVNALAAGHLCVFAMLLPQDFWEGEAKSMTMTSNYHQVAAIGYDLDLERIYFLNSWGKRFGNNGVGSVPIAFLTQKNNQDGHFYAYTTIDVIDGKVKPAPVRVITGYSDEAGVPKTSFVQGENLRIEGKGFGEKPGIVRFNSTDLLVVTWSDTVIRCVVSSAMKPGLYAPRITTMEGAIIDGIGLEVKEKKSTPAPTPTPTPTPVPPSGSLTIRAIARTIRGRYFITARIYDAKTKLAQSGCEVLLTVDGKLMEMRTTGRTGTAGWLFAEKPGKEAEIQATKSTKRGWVKLLLTG